jgi:hypothetical protein
MLRGRGNGGVTGIEIHLERVRDVARHDGALEKVDVLHHIDDAADVEQVLDRRFAVPGARVDHVDGGAGRAEIAALAPGLEVVTRVLRVQHEMPGSLGQRVLDQRGGEQQTTVVIQRAASAGQVLDAAFRSVGQADLRQEPQGRPVDLLDVIRRQGLVTPGFHAGLHGTEMVGQGARALRPAGVAPGRPASRDRGIGHVPLRRFRRRAGNLSWRPQDSHNSPYSRLKFYLPTGKSSRSETVRSSGREDPEIVKLAGLSPRPATS